MTVRPASGTPRAVWALAAAGVLFVALPLAGLAARAPWSSLAALWRPGARTALWLSLQVSVLAALAALALGAPVAWVLARASFPGRTIVRGLVLLPMVLPPVVAGVGLLTALGRNGVLGGPLDALGISLPFTTAGAVVASAFVAMPLVVLAIESGLRSAGTELEDAAAVMGASRWTVLRRVTVPIVRPQLAAGLVLAWARALGEFGATITFAGNLGGRTQTLPLAVFETLQTDPDAAILMSLALVVLSLGALVALRGRLLDR